jgi:hypothetical protein
MKRYLYSVVGLIAFYGLFFYGESIRIGAQKIIEFQQFFPVYLVLVPLALFFLPYLKGNFTPITLTAGFGIYLIFSLLNLSALNISDKGVILALIIEVFCLLTVLLLIIDIAHQNALLENLILSFITPPTEHKLLHMDEDQSIIDDEFYRGRRFGYPVSTLVLSFGDDIDKLDDSVSFQLLMNDLQQWIKNRYVFFRFTKVMGKLIRKSDLIVQMDDSHKLLLICPDTPANNLPNLATKIQKKFKESLDITVVCGTASFPDDGSTFRALISKADESLVNAFQATNINQ